MANPEQVAAVSLIYEVLPVELLVVIFEHFVTFSPPKLLVGSSPTRLCLVCRQWRDVAINCPKLWRAIGLTSTQLQRLSYLNVWLQRSKQLPLAVGLWTKGYYNCDQAVAEVLQTLWKSSRSDGRTYMVDEMELVLHQGRTLHIHPNYAVSYPSLRKLTIAQNGYSSPQPFLELIPSRSPNLEKLVWSGPNFSHVLASLVQSSSIATTLSDMDLETSLFTEDCFTIFFSFPLLRRCILRNVNDNPGPTRQFRELLTMLHLQELVVIGDINPLNIIRRLTASRLVSLTLSATNPKASFNTNDVNSLSMLSIFLLRSAASLRELTIEDIPLAHDEYNAILKILNELEMLSVYDGFSPSSQWDQQTKAHVVLQSLSPSEEFVLDSHTCPNLRTLILRGRIIAPDGLLSHLVEDRFDRSQRGEGVALESIQMESYRNVHIEDDERLQVLASKMANYGKNLKVKVSGVMLGQVVPQTSP
ncbi:hypothetical protein CPB83DRAFT_416547 [Crepidotus variabilis]|uniref:F-box domain-containing protein n=1 Tax=Crepidotus variabilis TaxID=179855 RepID=A0A9P6JUY1_9AGAR|nr:hypothetical protein CPB83DRAFT_416547 [Crepidotus variabilis]